MLLLLDLSTIRLSDILVQCIHSTIICCDSFSISQEGMPGLPPKPHSKHDTLSFTPASAPDKARSPSGSPSRKSTFGQASASENVSRCLKTLVHPLPHPPCILGHSHLPLLLPTAHSRHDCFQRFEVQYLPAGVWMWHAR